MYFVSGVFLGHLVTSKDGWNGTSDTCGESGNMGTCSVDLLCYRCSLLCLLRLLHSRHFIYLFVLNPLDWGIIAIQGAVRTLCSWISLDMGVHQWNLHCGPGHERVPHCPELPGAFRNTSVPSLPPRLASVGIHFILNEWRVGLLKMWLFLIIKTHCFIIRLTSIRWITSLVSLFLPALLSSSPGRPSQGTQCDMCPPPA